MYLGYDETLKRQVAIKVPQRQRRPDHSGADVYLKEARIVASLDHRAIVPVFDCGQTEDGACFVVSKYIEGTDLAIKARRIARFPSRPRRARRHRADALHSAP